MYGYVESPMKFVIRVLQTLIFVARLQIIRASLWLMGSVSACGLIVLVLALSGAAFINGIPMKFVVEGPGMQPTFHNGDVLQLAAYKPKDTLARGDIIILHVPGFPKDEPSFVRRVIGLPGETVEIRDTKVYVNGMALDEPYIAEPCDPSRCFDKIWKLGADEYFVMGDNRNHSLDSRTFGAVKAELIVAKVLSVANPNPSGVERTVTAIVATNNAVETLISATQTARAVP